jgi:hypothetical protein
MDSVSFEAFEPDGKKFHWTHDWIVGALLIPLIVSWIINGNNSGPAGDWQTLYVIGAFLVAMYFLLTSFFTYKSLNGTMCGEIIFKKDNIIVNDTTFLLNDLKELDFYFGDYYGEWVWTYAKSFNSKRSQGVNNYVIFTNNADESYQVSFRVQSEHGYQALAPFINEAVKLRKMDFKRASDLLGNDGIPV